MRAPRAYARRPRSHALGLRQVAHQFDRVIAADSGLYARWLAYRADADGDNDWLRTGVGNSFFQNAPQEIIASQVGNQYLLSSTTQLRFTNLRIRSGVTRLQSSLPPRDYDLTFDPEIAILLAMLR